MAAPSKNGGQEDWAVVSADADTPKQCPHDLPAMELPWVLAVDLEAALVVATSEVVDSAVEAAAFVVVIAVALAVEVGLETAEVGMKAEVAEAASATSQTDSPQKAHHLDHEAEEVASQVEQGAAMVAAVHTAETQAAMYEATMIALHDKTVKAVEETVSQSAAVEVVAADTETATATVETATTTASGPTTVVMVATTSRENSEGTELQAWFVARVYLILLCTMFHYSFVTKGKRSRHHSISSFESNRLGKDLKLSVRFDNCAYPCFASTKGR